MKSETKETKQSKALTSPEFLRLANNFYNAQNIPATLERMGVDANLINYVLSKQETLEKTYKVAFVWICLNPPYWQYAYDMIQGAKQFFLPGHHVDYFLWSDMPESEKDIRDRLNQSVANFNDPAVVGELDRMTRDLVSIRKDATIFPTEAVQWPLPTLMRYSLFLQQEEKLKEYDYIFYCDVDMKFVNVVGDEILGNGLTAAVHPGYHVDKKFIPPYEPNKDSEAFIPRPGKVIAENGKNRFLPLYYAGGFQGGMSKDFIQAMRVMKQRVDKDFSKNYIAIWNDESHWNKYLFENEPEIVLTPSYIFPDSLLEEYYYPLWGVRYEPKLVTLTKKFTTTAEGGAEAQKMMQQMKGLK